MLTHVFISSIFVALNLFGYQKHTKTYTPIVFIAITINIKADNVVSVSVQISHPNSHWENPIYKHLSSNLKDLVVI